MKTLINKKIIIFDLYDTLIDASKLRNPLKKLSLLLPDNSSRRHELKNFILTNDFISLEELIHTVEREFVISVKSNVLEEIRFGLYEDLKNVSLFRETRTVLARLRENYDLYLASNLSTLYIPPVYSLGLDEYFKSFFFHVRLD